MTNESDHQFEKRRNRPRYGADGFPYIVGLSAAALIFGALGVLGLTSSHGRLRTAAAVSLLVGFLAAVPAALGMRYVVRGKFLLRDTLLSYASIQPGDVAADFGAGAGLLGIGAAKLGAARVHCIDLFIAKDLSANSKERLLSNALIEGVHDRVELRELDVRDTGLEGESVDVALSTLCIHNLPDANDRRLVLQEMVRVLRPGGRIVISDLAHVNDEYAPLLRSWGLSIDRSEKARATFPPQRLLVATKVTATPKSDAS
jgi:arsenite methyltransferase